MRQGVLPFQYAEEKSTTGMTALSGLMTYLELIHVSGLRSSVERHVGLRERGQGWTDNQIVNSLILLDPVSSTGQAMDATLVETHKQDALYSYKKYRAYQPLTTSYGATGQPLTGQRPI